MYAMCILKIVVCVCVCALSSCCLVAFIMVNYDLASRYIKLNVRNYYW